MLKRFSQFGFIFCLPSMAFADSDTFFLDSVLNNLIDLMTSDIARLLFVLAVIGTGYAWIGTGRLPKKWAVSIILGIGLVFSASTIAQKLGVGG